jgi:hypothetical protein
MDYILVYKTANNKKYAAIPDDEGVYKNKMPFEEYKESMSELEVIILKSEDYYSAMHKQDYEDEYISFVIDGRFVASRTIESCIKKLGFELFFTKIIKEHLYNIENDS